MSEHEENKWKIISVTAPTVPAWKVFADADSAHSYFMRQVILWFVVDDGDGPEVHGLTIVDINEPLFSWRYPIKRQRNDGSLVNQFASSNFLGYTNDPQEDWSSEAEANLAERKRP